jgi:hypothetical protein
MYADLFVQSLLPAHTEVEREFEWVPRCDKGHGGRSGMDALVLDGPLRAHYEFKTSSKSAPRPLAYNVRQVHRQRVVMARGFGITDAELPPSVIFIIEKSGQTTGKINGPYHIQPTETELADAQEDIDIRTLVYQDVLEDGIDPLDHPLLKKIQRNGCYNCFAMPKAEADAKVEALMKEYHTKNREFEKLKVWRDEFREERLRPLVEKGVSLQTEKYDVKHSKAGKLLITQRKIYGKRS